MFKRTLEAELKELVKFYPVVTLLGPRQSGKTTLVKALFSEKPYVNLENLDVRALASDDPRGFLEKYGQGAIFDEIQRAPELLSYIQTWVDEKDEKGLFILIYPNKLKNWHFGGAKAPGIDDCEFPHISNIGELTIVDPRELSHGPNANSSACLGMGSHQMALHEAITQSLAGRTALVTLLPMSIDELVQAGIDLPLDEMLIKGGYPRIHKEGLDPTKAYRNYFQTYVERDLRQLINIKDLTQFQRFVQILAGRIGQIVNFQEIGGEVGISSHTVKEWLSILEASFVIFRLQSYFENFGKRVIKSPKLFFVDLGLATYLLGIKDVNQMSRDPLRGHLVENLVILEILKGRYNQGLDPDLYYYRDVQKNEVDLIFKEGHELTPIEIKSSKTYHSEFLKGLHFFQNLVGERSPKGYLIYAGEEEQYIHKIHLLNYKHVLNILSFLSD